MKKVIIIGTGGHAKVVADIVLSNNDTIYGFLTSDENILTFLGKPVLGTEEDYAQYKDCHFIIAIGNQNVRERIANSMKMVNWYTAIHPSCVISSINTRIGEGCVISANAVINANATIGKHSIINTNATVEHDNIIEEFAHISVGAKLGGNVFIGRKTWVGIGATVKNSVSVCNDCMIGAGAVVVKNIDNSGVFVGVPARIMTYEKQII